MATNAELKERDHFGVTRFKVTLRIHGPDLDPASITQLLGREPTKSRPGHWSLTVTSVDHEDIEIAINDLLDRLPTAPEFWTDLTDNYKVDLFCGAFLEYQNEGFGLAPATSRRLADRNLPIGFDLYGA